MNTEIIPKSEMDTIFPEGKVVKIPRPGGMIEEITVRPMPLRKWKRAIEHVVVLAPLLGFNLTEQKVQLETGEEMVLPAMSEADALAGLMQKVTQIVMSDDYDKLISLLAFAIDRDEDFLGDLYDEVIDLAVIVISENLIFFCQRLLPKLLMGAVETKAMAEEIKRALQK